MPYNDGWPIFGETCTHYLTLDHSDCLDKPGFEGAKYICSPPLRPQRGMWTPSGGGRARGLADRSWF